MMTNSLIYETIKKYVALERRGGEYVGKCPWCGEKNLRVNTDKGLFYCDTCGQGGNAAKFLSLIENISYSKAERLLSKETRRAIKFRAMARDGRVVFGDLMQEANLKMIVHDGFRDVIKPETVAQLVCTYDGREYYEGDILEFEGKKFVATLEEVFLE